MPQKAKPKVTKKRARKPGKIADLPVKSLKGKVAAKVKGGLNPQPEPPAPLDIKIGDVKIISPTISPLTNRTVKL